MTLIAKRLRQAAVFVAGILVIIIGIILIPLPGPGLVVVLLGLMLLAREFEWAKRHVTRVKGYLAVMTAKAKAAVDKTAK